MSRTLTPEEVIDLEERLLQECLRRGPLSKVERLGIEQRLKTLADKKAYYSEKR